MRIGILTAIVSLAGTMTASAQNADEVNAAIAAAINADPTLTHMLELQDADAANAAIVQSLTSPQPEGLCPGVLEADGSCTPPGQ